MYTGTLKGNQSKEFSFREWIDYATTNDEGLNKKYESKISVVVNPEIKVEEEIGIQFNLENKTITGTINGSINKIEVCESELNECIPDNEESIIENSITREIKASKLVKTSIGLLEVNETVTKMICSKLNSEKVICSYPYTFENKPNFSKTSCLAGTNNETHNSDNCDEETNGLYEEITNLGKTYYYRGSVNNNWVKFGTSEDELPIWWRIVRINEDGTIRLLYAGKGEEAPSKDNSGYWINNSYNIESKFNKIVNQNAYVGYMYGIPGSDSFESEHGYDLIDSGDVDLLQDSYIKTVIDSWYINNLQEEEKALSGSTGFCGERSLAIGFEGKGYSNQVTYYKADDKIFKKRIPSFDCLDSAHDLYTTKNNKGTGNGALDYPIGLITIDEASYAGGIGGNVSQKFNNYGYWLWTGNVYWTLSPSTFSINDNGYFAAISYVGNNGNLYANSAFNSYAVRPVVNVKPEYFKTESKEGTISNPYFVEI